MNRKKILLMALAFVCAAGISRAEGRSDNTEARMRKLEAALARMETELKELRAEQAKIAEVPVDRKKIDAMVDKAFEEKKADLKLVPDWVNNLKIKGDFRYRHEWIDDESEAADRNRHRIRARVGVYGKINDEVDFGVRLASGSTTATTTNQDLTGGFSSKDIFLDLAYFDYHPAAVQGLKVLGGKIKNPYHKVGNSDLMFDNDVTPEGIAATYKTKLGDNTDAFGTFGGYYVAERENDADTSLWALQTGLTYQIPNMEKVYVTGGGGYFGYGNVQGETALDGFNGNKNDGTDYDSDFDIIQAFGEVGFPVCGLPFKVFGEYLENTGADSGEDHGYLLGASIGKCKKPGSWQFAYNYRQLDADAVIGALTEGTFAGGGTNVKGHTLSLAYQLAKNWQLGVSYMLAEKTDTATDNTTDHDVVLVDLKFKF